MGSDDSAGEWLASSGIRWDRVGSRSCARRWNWMSFWHRRTLREFGDTRVIFVRPLMPLLLLDRTRTFTGPGGQRFTWTVHGKCMVVSNSSLASRHASESFISVTARYRWRCCCPHAMVRNWTRAGTADPSQHCPRSHISAECYLRHFHHHGKNETEAGTPYPQTALTPIERWTIELYLLNIDPCPYASDSY